MKKETRCGSTLDGESEARNLIICHDNLAVSLPETGDKFAPDPMPGIYFVRNL